MSKKAAARAARPHKSKSAKTATEACASCGETLDISQAAELHSRLMDALATRRAITLDTSAVERADTAALQVLCSIVCDARAENIAVTWRALR